MKTIFATMIAIALAGCAAQAPVGKDTIVAAGAPLKSGTGIVVTRRAVPGTYDPDYQPHGGGDGGSGK